MDNLTEVNSIKELEQIFNEAYESGYNSIAVEMTIPHRTETEIVFHRKQTIFNRLNYYKRTFDENLKSSNFSCLSLESSYKSKRLLNCGEIISRRILAN